MTAIGVTGHQHIPVVACGDIRSGLDTVLRSHRDLIGVCCLAAGADQLFAKAVLDRGGTLHVIIPCEHYEQTLNAVDFSRFHELLQAAKRVDTLEHPQPTEEAFLDAGQRVVDLCDVLIAVWDGQPARGFGGTADVVDYARAAGRDIVVIWPPGVVR